MSYLIRFNFKIRLVNTFYEVFDNGRNVFCSQNFNIKLFFHFLFRLK